MEVEAISWTAAEPRRLQLEREAMARVAPQLVWLDTPAGGWEGYVPDWPMERVRPKGLDSLLGGARLKVRVEYTQAFPMDAPRLIPIDPEPDVIERTQHERHLNGDGTLCLLRGPAEWDPSATAADLVEKAAGWFIEYRALQEGLIDKMSETGLYRDDYLDATLDAL